MSNLQEQARKEAQEFKTRSMFGRVFVLGVNFLAGPLVLGFFGRWLDHKTHHEYRYFIIGVILGLVWAFYESFKMAWYISRDDKKNEAENEQK
ncbi:MAG: AtpZ/AtpI family protein [Fibrobacterota bacterium]